MKLECKGNNFSFRLLDHHFQDGRIKYDILKKFIQYKEEEFDGLTGKYRHNCFANKEDYPELFN